MQDLLSTHQTVKKMKTLRPFRNSWRRPMNNDQPSMARRYANSSCGGPATDSRCCV